MPKKLWIIVLSLLVSNCAITEESDIHNWKKSHISLEQLEKAMKYCGYNDRYELSDKSPDEIAAIHMCMVKHGYDYIDIDGHYCKKNHSLTSCLKAKKQGIIN